MARRRRVAPRQNARKFVWARYQLDHIIPAEDTSFIDVLQEFFVDYSANILGATVMRIRGELEFEPATTPVDNVSTAAGFIVMSRNVAANITAGAQAGGPLTDKHADWMAYQPLIFSSRELENEAPRWLVDVKSARKMEEVGDGLFLAVENPIVGTAITVRGLISVGFKLP